MFYFALVSFTTLGFGDIVIGQEWRLLSEMIAANGLHNIGMSTAILIEVMRQLRVTQQETARKTRQASRVHSASGSD